MSANKRILKFLWYDLQGVIFIALRHALIIGVLCIIVTPLNVNPEADKTIITYLIAYAYTYLPWLKIIGCASLTVTVMVMVETSILCLTLCNVLKSPTITEWIHTREIVLNSAYGKHKPKEGSKEK